MNIDNIKAHIELKKAQLAKLEALGGQWLYVVTEDGEQIYMDYATSGPANQLKDFLLARLTEEIVLCEKMLRDAEEGGVMK